MLFILRNCECLYNYETWNSSQSSRLKPWKTIYESIFNLWNLLLFVKLSQPSWSSASETDECFGISRTSLAAKFCSTWTLAFRQSWIQRVLRKLEEKLTDCRRRDCNNPSHMFPASLFPQLWILPGQNRPSISRWCFVAGMTELFKCPAAKKYKKIDLLPLISSTHWSSASSYSSRVFSLWICYLIMSSLEPFGYNLKFLVLADEYGSNAFTCSAVNSSRYSDIFELFFFRSVFNWVSKNQTRIITLANHNQRKQHDEPIRTRKKK